MKFKPLLDANQISSKHTYKSFMLNDDLNRIFVFDNDIYQVQTEGWDEIVAYEAITRVVWKLSQHETTSIKWWYCIQESELPKGVIKACSIWMGGSYDIPISEFLNGLFNE
jgi:hypothetical protein